ncbi:lysophospholipase [Baekduia soli]|uniref:Lysophospholipase n=1 Tax=Baekduia soli TaxID=496014 RepID=A0A5B8U9Z7_9ACTN|nr:alpha/beta fold hydrolase [Baekduia soli]QEC50029.1 lysophospholipase [Baekduia soli]
MRTVRAEPPVETGTTDGLAWARFAPAGAGDAPPAAGVVVLHGADSTKENHADFARVCAAHGLAALVFDARGHGASGGTLDGRAIDDVARMADTLRERAGVQAVGLRGSSMGAYLALVAAGAARAGAVVAICPAPALGLAVGLRAGRFAFGVDREGLTALLEAHNETDAARALDVPLLLLHAEGDEAVPVELSRALHAAVPASRLVVVPGGHHRSIQHDPELQGEAARFLAGHLSARPGAG